MTLQSKMYTDLAEWFTTLSAPQEYAEEAALYHSIFQEVAESPIQTILELGAGSGNNASHLKQHYTMTLVDLSPQMSAESQKLNPDCEHHVGDMRSFRLNRQFDAVFIHDAIDYMLTLDDLQAAITTAELYCKAGGVIMIVPDFVRETFTPYTSYGGHDTPKSMRYLEWVWQINPDARTYYTDFTYLIRINETEMQSIYDRHICGLFSKNEWFKAFTKVGLEVEMRESIIEGDSDSRQPIFVAKKRA
jgi:ubiquinone/menaquinone biosynthesis C-methylase UbiE